MPNPVVIPAGALPITDSVNDLAEKMVADAVQIIKYGTTGSAVVTKPVTLPVVNGGTTTLALDTEERQSFLRIMAIALANHSPNKLDSWLAAGLPLASCTAVTVGTVTTYSSGSEVLMTVDVTVGIDTTEVRRVFDGVDGEGAPQLVAQLTIVTLAAGGGSVTRDV